MGLERILILRDMTGCGLKDCKEALDYANNDIDMAVAYIKAKSYAVKTSGLSFDERVKYFMEEGNK